MSAIIRKLPRLVLELDGERRELGTSEVFTLRRIVGRALRMARDDVRALSKLRSAIYPGEDIWTNDGEPEGSD